LAPDVEIIELGTNDANHIADPLPKQLAGSRTVAQVNARLDLFDALFAASTCVVFVTVNTHNPSWHPRYGRAINDHIRAKFAHVADWDAAWKASYFAVPDDPHPNAAGRQALITVDAAPGDRRGPGRVDGHRCRRGK
jgi:lysophospholipase L1-like esterase